MTLDELLEERPLFIAHDAAVLIAMDVIGPRDAAPKDAIGLMMFVAQKSSLCFAAKMKVEAMRAAGVL